MKINDVLDFCDLILAQYGNLDVVIFAEFPDQSEFTVNDAFCDLIEIPVSRLGDKTKLVMGLGVGKDVRYEEDQKIKQREKPKLRLIEGGLK